MAALVVAVLAGLVVVLVTHDVPRWIPIAIGVATTVFLVVFVAAMSLRDPEHRLRNAVVRGLMFLATLTALKTLAGWTVDLVARVKDVDATVRLALGQPWYIDLAALVFAIVCVAAALRAYVMQAPAAERKVVPPAMQTIEDATPPAPVMPEVFIERVKLLLTHRAIARHELELAGEQGYLVGTRHDLKTPRPILVRCDDRAQPVTAADVETALTAARSIAAELYYVTVGAEASPVLIAGFPDVRFFQEPQLLDELVDFDGYLRRMIEIYEKAPLPYSLVQPPRTLARTFVPPRFTVQGAAHAPSAALHKYLDDWLGEAGPRQIALLADYGMGKSSFLKYYAAYLARERLEKRSKRIPILISLTGQSPRTTPRAPGLINGFIERYKLRCEYGAFDVLMRSGSLVFLLDAFDEMDLVGDRAMRLDHFAALWELYVPGNKILLAGRPTFFPEDAELEEALRIGRGTARHSGRMYCDRVNLAPFELTDIRASFDCYFDAPEARRHFAFVSSRPRLVDLARRPAMTHIIRDSMHTLPNDPELASSAALREAMLLDIYTRHWIDRQLDVPRRLLVTKETRREFVERLAEWMFDSELKVQQVPSAKLVELYEQWFPNEAKAIAGSEGAARPHMIEGIETDLRNCTFMVPSDTGFAFAHKPFYEFFVAARLDRLLARRQSLPFAFRKRLLAPEICLHAGDLWFARSGKNIEKEAKDVVEEFVGDALPLRQEGRRNVLQILVRAGVSYRWIEHEMFNPVLHFFGFHTWGPLSLTELDLGGASFEKANLRHISLSGKDLRAARFLGAQLHDVHLIGASLAGARFDNATLDRVIADDADLTDVALDGATIRNSSFVRATARGASFRHANLVEVNLKHAMLDRATFESATLQSVDLTASSLVKANLQVVQFREVHANRARIVAPTSGITTFGTVAEYPDPLDADAPFVGPCSSVRWSNDGSMLATVSRGVAWLFDAGHGALIARITELGESVTEVELSDDAVTIATREGTLKTLRLDGLIAIGRTQIVAQKMALGPGGASACAWTPGKVEVYRLEPAGWVHTWSVPWESEPSALAVDAAGSRIAFGIESGYTLYGIADRPAGSVQVPNPTKLAFDRTGTLFMASNGKRCVVHQLDSTGTQSSESSSGNRVSRDLVPSYVLEATVAGLGDDGKTLAWVNVGKSDRVRLERLLAVWSIIAEYPRMDEVSELAVSSAGGIACVTPTGIELLLAISGQRRPRAHEILAASTWSDGLSQVRRLLRRQDVSAGPASSRMLIPNIAFFSGDTAIDTAFLKNGHLQTIGPGSARVWSVDALEAAEPQARHDAAWSPQALTSQDPDVLGTLHSLQLNISLGNSTIVDEDVHHAALSPSGRLVAFARFDGVLWIREGDLSARLRLDLAVDRRRYYQTDVPCSLAFSFDDEALLEAEGALLRVWSRTGGSLAEWTPGRPQAGQTQLKIVPTAIAVSGRRGSHHEVWIASRTGSIDLWIPGSSEPETRWTLASHATALDVSRDGQRLAAATNDGSILLIELAPLWRGGTPPAPLVIGKHRDRATGVKFSPDGTLLASTGRDDVVRLWNVEQRGPVAALHHLPAGWASVRPDGAVRWGGDVSMLRCRRGLTTFALDELPDTMRDVRNGRAR